MAQITVDELTTGAIDGTGVFDVLMQSVNAQLADQFKKNRITAAAFGDVYMGSMQSAMQYALQFVLGHQEADKQAELLAAQTLKVGEETQLVIKQRLKVIEETQNVVTQRANLVKDQLKTQAEIDVLNEQENNLKAENTLTNQRTLNLAAEKQTILLGQTKLEAETSLVNQQTKNAAASLRKMEAEIKLLDQQVLNAIEQIAKSQAETALINARKDTELEQPAKIQADVAFTEAKTLNVPKEGNLLDKQVEKSTAEIAVLNQKKLTEEAQIVDRVTGATADVAGILGKQKTLYQMQADGFLRDAEQKILKAMLDVYNVTLSTDPGAVNPDTSKVDATNIGQVVAKAAAGINLTLT